MVCGFGHVLFVRRPGIGSGPHASYTATVFPSSHVSSSATVALLCRLLSHCRGELILLDAHSRVAFVQRSGVSAPY